MSKAGGDSNREKGGFVVINGQARGLLKELKKALGLKDGLMSTSQKNKSVIGVLEHGTGITRDQGVRNGGSNGWQLEETAQTSATMMNK